MFDVLELRTSNKKKQLRTNLHAEHRTENLELIYRYDKKPKCSKGSLFEVEF
jgi:hypothetical protein